jgi:hypothetical protein
MKYKQDDKFLDSYVSLTTPRVVCCPALRISGTGVHSVDGESETKKSVYFCRNADSLICKTVTTTVA